MRWSWLLVGLCSSPYRAQLRHRRDDLVVGIPELVAARAEVLVALLVDGDLDRRALEVGEDLPLVDAVRPGGAEIAGGDHVAGQALEPDVPADVPHLELPFVRREALGV